jgi:hypothetical protein
MIEIHTKICAQQGITARLEHCKQKQKERNRDQAKKKGVKTTRTSTRSQGNTKGKGQEKGKGKRKRKEDESDDESDLSDVCSVPDGDGVGRYVGRGVPDRILDERVLAGVKEYLITWIDLPESADSWELASEYDDGVYGGAYVELVAEWEEYKRTDQQYAGLTTTPTHTQTHKKATTKPKTTTKPKPTRKRARTNK